MRRAAFLLATVTLAGCGYGQSRMAHEAQTSMIGMSSADLHACAGPPTSTTKISDVAEVETYAYKPAGNGGLTVTLPLTLGAVAIGGGGIGCLAMVRVVDNRVTEVHYSGDDDQTIGNDGVCAPVIRGCMRQPEPSMQPVTGANYDHSSAFSSPAVPPQPADAQVPAKP
jgi:hypothetical protein